MNPSTTAHILEDKERTKDVIINEQLNFNALLLSDSTLSGLLRNGFRVPSPIQLKAIPIGKCGFDLFLKSKSGTGKTAVFAIVSLELINVNKNAVQVLIIAPTREIAVQIKDVLQSIGSGFNDLAVHCFIGGIPIEEDLKLLKRCHIAVGAPGRIKHLNDLGALKLDQVKLLVLDEADKLVSSDMKAEIENILKKLPATKQVIASSATYKDEVITYLNSIMSSPTLIEPHTDTPLLLGLKQFVKVVKGHLNVLHQLNIKYDELHKILMQVTFSQCVIFTNYQCRAESISNTLNRKGWRSLYISSAQTQAERLHVINSLKKGDCRILVSTDVTARGIDIANIDLVINYDVPTETSTYLHRMGRAGRFGSYGVCITLAARGKELSEYCRILGGIGGVNMYVPELPEDLPNDMWNADTTSFKLIKGTLDENQSVERNELLSSVIDLKKQRASSRKKRRKHSINEIESIESKQQIPPRNSDVDMLTVTEATEALLESNELKEKKIIVVSESIVGTLESIASGESNCNSLQNDTLKQHFLSDILSEMSGTKKRKRPPTCTKGKQAPCEDLDKKKNLDLKCKNTALFYATKLLSDPYNQAKISEEILSPIKSYLEIMNEGESTNCHNKNDILKLATNEEEKDVACPNDNVNNEIIENKTCSNVDLEDIFQLSYHYAINDETAHWLDVLGEELQEKMSLKEASCHNSPQTSCYEEMFESSNMTRRKKQRTHKKKTFKDFTRKNKTKKNTEQAVETIDASNAANQIDSNYLYQAGLYSDAEYGANQHFTSCFGYYSDELTENLQTFEDVTSFNTWFDNWQWQVQGVRDYIQQNIYLQEMNKYTYYKNSQFYPQ